jgi:trigger factor
MQVHLETSTGLARTLRVNIPAERVEGAVAARLKRIAAKAKLPGFRPGKAPFKVIESQYKDSARFDVINDLINETFPKALDEVKQQPAGAPKFDLSSMANGLEYTASFEVYPEISLNTSGLSVSKPHVEISEADIDRLIENLRKSRRIFADASRAAATGDQVTVDFLGTLEGEAFPGGEGRDVQFEIGAGQFLPDLENGIAGHAAGEQFTVDVAFPEDYRAEKLKGKTAQFAVTMKAVKEATLPALDDVEFLKAHGAEDIDSLRSKSKTALENERNKAIKNRVKAQVLDQLLAANPIDVPSVLIQQEVPRLREEALARMGNTNIPEEKKAELFPAALFEASAKRRVSLGLLIGEVIKTREIKLDPARVEATLTEMAGDYEDPAEVKSYYRGRQDLMQGLRSVVLEEQVVESLTAGAEVTDAAMTLEQLLNPQQAPAAA